MKIMKKTALLGILLFTVLLSFGLSGCKSTKNSESGIAIVSEESFNSNVKIKNGKLSAFDISKLGELEEPYIAKGEYYYACVFVKDAEVSYYLSVVLGGDIDIHESYALCSDKSVELSLRNKRSNALMYEYEDAELSEMYAETLVYVETDKNSKNFDCYVAIRFSVNEVVSDKSMIRVGIDENGYSLESVALECEKQVAYEKRITVSSQVKFLTRDGY